MIRRADAALVHEERTHVRKLIGGILAASIVLQASFFIGAQDFGRRAVPFGFCHKERQDVTFHV